jgi:hypothetical protein
VTAAVRTEAERINRIRRRLVNSQVGFQAGDVQALLCAYDRAVAELAELRAGVPIPAGR